jgi:hypothetical protein
VNFGIKTGLNQAFILDRQRYDELVADDPKSAEIIRPLAMGDDIRRYYINFRDRYLILTKIGVDIKNYPSVFQHLKQYQKQLEKRWDKGNHWWELRACDYYDELEKPKIVFPDITKDSRFSLDEEGLSVINTIYFLPINDLFLLGILNSALIWFYLINTCSVYRGDYLRLFKQFIDLLPIRQLDFSSAKDKEYHDKIVSLVQTMLDLNKKLHSANTPSEKTMLQRQINATDRQIDKLVYDLYGLTDEEITIVEETTKKV